MIGTPNLEIENNFIQAATAKKTHPRAKFSQSEDQKLLSLVENFGTNDWQLIAHHMPGRNSRQCRDRWHNYLSPDVVNGPWTTEEENLLTQKYEELGPSWKQIASFFPTRTDINIKSRWHLMERRVKKEELQIKRALFGKKPTKIAPTTINPNIIQQTQMNLLKQMNFVNQNNQITANIQHPQPINRQIVPNTSNQKARIHYLMPMINNMHVNNDINTSPLPFFPSKISPDVKKISEINISPEESFDPTANDCLDMLLMNDDNNFLESIFDSWF